MLCLILCVCVLFLFYLCYICVWSATMTVWHIYHHHHQLVSLYVSYIIVIIIMSLSLVCVSVCVTAGSGWYTQAVPSGWGYSQGRGQWWQCKWASGRSSCRRRRSKALTGPSVCNMIRMLGDLHIQQTVPPWRPKRGRQSHNEAGWEVCKWHELMLHPLMWKPHPLKRQHYPRNASRSWSVVSHLPSLAAVLTASRSKEKEMGRGRRQSLSLMGGAH